MEPWARIELATSSLPWMRSTTELPGHGAGRGIRTPEGISQQIYSLPCLTASLSLLVQAYAQASFCRFSVKSFGLVLCFSSQNIKQSYALLGLIFWEITVLFLRCVVPVQIFKPAKCLNSGISCHAGNCSDVEPMTGIEPATRGLQNRCSTS